MSAVHESNDQLDFLSSHEILITCISGDCQVTLKNNLIIFVFASILTCKQISLVITIMHLNMDDITIDGFESRLKHL